MYKEYKMEKFKDSTPKKRPRIDMRKVNKIVSSKPTFKVDTLKDLTPIDSLNTTPGKRVSRKRKLPTESLYYTETFTWTNSVKPGKFEDTKHEEPRIIIPFKRKDGSVFGFQGRSLSSTGLRYITIL